MDLNSPFFDRIRIKPTCEEPARDATPVCERQGCTAPGQHRAPKGRGQEGRYWQFCVEHVREYNKSYNYFAGMSDDAVQAYQKDDTIGHRPTWGMGVNSATRRRRDGGAPPTEEFDYLDPFNLHGASRTKQRARRREPEAPSRPAPIRRAFETLDLDESASAAAIKAKYKALVKRFHPDAHGGDRSFEDRLRDIIRAHDTLKAAGLC